MMDHTGAAAATVCHSLCDFFMEKRNISAWKEPQAAEYFSMSASQSCHCRGGADGSSNLWLIDVQSVWFTPLHRDKLCGIVGAFIDDLRKGTKG